MGWRRLGHISGNTRVKPRQDGVMALGPGERLLE